MHGRQFRDCGAEALLRLFAITKAGLLAITLAVCALWACIALERVTIHRANLEARRTLLRLERLRRPAVNVPVASPSPLPFVHSRPAEG